MRPPTFASTSAGPGGGAPEHGVKPHASFLALIGLAGRLLGRRIGVFGPAVVVAIGLQALVAIVWRVPHGVDLDSFIVLPILTTLVYAFVGADGGVEPVPARAVWERFLERSWAVIVIDFVLTLLSGIGLSSSLSSNPLDIFVGIFFFGLSAALVFTDASATVDDDVTVWSVLPRAFARSIAAAWRGPVFVRALAIFSVELLVYALQSGLYALLRRNHVPEALFWSQIPLVTAVVPPLAALTALVYLDAAPARDEAAE